MTGPMLAILVVSQLAAFRFGFGEPGSALLFIALVVGGALLVAVPSILQARALRVLRERTDLEAIQKRFDELDLDPGEHLIFQTILEASGVSSEQFVTSVAHFDRGVDSFLARSDRLPSIQRVDLLRTIRSLRHKLGFDQVAPHRILESTRALPMGQSLTVALPRSKKDECLVNGTISQLDDEGISITLAGRSEAALLSLQGADAEVEVHFFRADDSAYFFRSPVFEVRDRESTILRIGHPKKLVRQQRRNFLRVDVDEPVRFRWFPTAVASQHGAVSGELQHVMDVHRGQIVNISGGGVQLDAPGVEMGLDDWIEIHFPFLPSPLDRERCLARVVQIYEEPPDGVFGVRFEKPSVRLQTAILRDVEARARHLRTRTEVLEPVAAGVAEAGSDDGDGEATQVLQLPADT